MAERSPTDRDIVNRHLRRAWQAVAPAPDLQERVRARLTSSTAATLGAVALGMGSNARPVSAWASLRASGKLGALVGVGLVGLGLVSGYLIRDGQEDVEAPAAAPVHRSAAVELPVPPSQVVRVPERESDDAVVARSDISEALRDEPASDPPMLSPKRSVRSRVNEPARPARPSADGNAAQPSDELALLRRADRAVRADNSALALALIGELDARHASSKLLEERRAIELLAYCGVGATDANARAKRFLHEHPSSVYAGRIRELCPVTGDPSTLAPR